MAGRFSVETIFKAIDQMSKPLARMKGSVASFTASAKKGFEGVSSGLDKMAGKARTGFGLIGLGGGFALKAAADMETLTISFETMTGSAENAKKLVGDLRSFAASTPFQLAGIGQATKQLLSFGVAQEEMLGTLKFLGDIAAGANVPLTDMAAIFGKSKAKGKAMTEELLQLSDRGIPIIDVLATQLNKSKSEIFEMASKGKISFQILTKAMKSMSEEGGIFQDQMKRQSETLAGVFSTLKDNIFDLMVQIGDVAVETFDLKTQIKDLTDWIKNAGKNSDQFKMQLQGFVETAVGLAGVLVTIIVLNKAWAAAMITGQAIMLAWKIGVVAFNGVLLVLKGTLALVRLATWALTVAFWANPIGLLIGAFTALIAVGVLLVVKWKSIKGFFVGLWASMTKGIQNFIDKFAILKLALKPFMLLMKGLKKLGISFGITSEDSTSKEQQRAEKARENRQVITPDQRVASSVEEKITKEQAELIIKDETGQADILSNFTKQSGIGLNLIASGDF